MTWSSRLQAHSTPMTRRSAIPRFDRHRRAALPRSGFPARDHGATTRSANLSKLPAARGTGRKRNARSANRAGSLRDAQVMQGKGCEQFVGGTGYKGRMGIFEFYSRRRRSAT